MLFCATIEQIVSHWKIITEAIEQFSQLCWMGITSSWASASLVALFPSSNKSRLSAPLHLFHHRTSQRPSRYHLPPGGLKNPLIYCTSKFDKSHEHLWEGYLIWMIRVEFKPTPWISGTPLWSVEPEGIEKHTRSLPQTLPTKSPQIRTTCGFQENSGVSSIDLIPAKPMVPQLLLRDGFCQTVLLLQLGLKAILKFMTLAKGQSNNL